MALFIGGPLDGQWMAIPDVEIYRLPVNGGLSYTALHTGDAVPLKVIEYAKRTHYTEVNTSISLYVYVDPEKGPLNAMEELIQKYQPSQQKEAEREIEELLERLIRVCEVARAYTSFEKQILFIDTIRSAEDRLASLRDSQKS